MRLHIRCPNCGRPAYGYKQRELSNVVTEVAYECRNPMCGARFIFCGEVTRWLNVPNMLNPRLTIPLSPLVERRAVATAVANLPTADVPQGEMVDAIERDQLDIFYSRGASNDP